MEFEEQPEPHPCELVLTYSEDDEELNEELEYSFVLSEQFVGKDAFGEELENKDLLSTAIESEPNLNADADRPLTSHISEFRNLLETHNLDAIPGSKRHVIDDLSPVRLEPPEQCDEEDVKTAELGPSFDEFEEYLSIQ